MLKIVKEPEIEKNVIMMRDMRLLQVGIINKGIDKGTIVMRTEDPFNFEVLNLSNPGKERGWTNDNSEVEVRLLPKGEKITIELFNE